MFESDVQVLRFSSFKYLNSEAREEKHLRHKPPSRVRFTFDERPERVEEWLRSCFILPDTFALIPTDRLPDRDRDWDGRDRDRDRDDGDRERDRSSKDDVILVYFVAVCDIGLAVPAGKEGEQPKGAVLSKGMSLCVHGRQVKEGGQTQLKMSLHCESMDLAAELLQVDGAVSCV